MTFTLNDGDGTANGGVDTATANAIINITAGPNGVEGPVLGGATSATVNEDSLVTLGVTDTAFDGNSTLGTVTISGLPSDLSGFNGGTYDAANGTWTGTAAQFNALTFDAGETSATLLISATSTTGGQTATTQESYTLTVSPVAENPLFSGATASSANEQGGLITLGATVATQDSDDGVITVTIAGLSNDLSGFNGGTYEAANGTWTGTGAEFNALTFNAGEDGVQNLTITATTSGAEAGSAQESYTLTVDPVTEGPVLGGATSATVNAGALVVLGVTEAKFDADDTLGTVTISGLPSDLSGFNGGTYDAANGTWTGTAAQFNALTFDAGETSATLLISATSTTGGQTATTQESYTLTVSPVAENPLFSGATASSANEQGGLITLGATVATQDSDDGVITVTIAGLSNDLSGFNGGTYEAANGTWTGTGAEFNALTFNAGEDGVQNLTITATTSGAEAGSAQESYTLTVRPNTWVNPLGGAWSNPSNWSFGTVPAATQNAVIGVLGTYTVTSSADATVAS